MYFEMLAPQLILLLENPKDPKTTLRSTPSEQRLHPLSYGYSMLGYLLASAKMKGT